MSVFLPDKDKAKLYVQFFWTKITPNLNISARMSWPSSEILKTFKKLAVVYYQVKFSQIKFLNLLIQYYSSYF